MKKIILIKMGGSLITEKVKPFTARLSAVKSIAAELKEIIAKEKDTYFLLGNGAGSFGHYPAQKYEIKDGIKNEKQLFGFAAVQDGVARLNRIVVNALLEEGIAACSLHPSTFLTASGGKKNKLFTGSLFGFLASKIIPIIYGDIVYDEVVGCHIFSTEDLFSLFIPELIGKGYKIEKIIQLTTVSGVLDENKDVIPSITPDTIEEVKKHIYHTEGFDVTGGMLHKIEAALVYVKLGIPTYIIQGDTKEALLTHSISGNNVPGTVIHD